MIAEFCLPDLGEGLRDAELVQWLVAPGDDVALNQPIAEVETAKAVVELPSPFAGIVQELHATAGDVIAVGAPVITIEAVGAEPTRRAPASTPGATDDGAERTPNLVGYGAAPRDSARPRRRARTHRAPAGVDAAVLDAAPHDATPAPVDPRPERPRSTPPVRAHARALGIDLAQVDGRDPGGLITRDDIDALAARRGELAAFAGARRESGASIDGVDTERLPIGGVRRRTAEAMVRSAFTAPHVTTFLDVDVTGAVDLVAGLREDRRAGAHTVGMLAVVARAVCLALPQHPDLNARWDEADGVIERYRFVHLGIAAATERGLLVPNVKHAERLGLFALAEAIGALAVQARAGRADLAALTGGTFTITNFGVFGIDAGTPILNPGEAGILGLGAVRRRPWEHRGEIALRDVATLSLSFDHRLVDGAQAAGFLRAVGELLSDPGRALTYA